MDRTVRIPPEILSIIFQFCLPGPQAEFSPSLAPLLLTRICGHWRRVAHSTPQLWMELNVPSFQCEPFHVRGNALKFIDVIESTLPLSSPSSLSFSMDLGDFQFRNDDEENMDAALKCFRLFCQHSHRWQTASLSTVSLRTLASQLQAGDLPLLEQLMLVGVWESDDSAIVRHLLLSAPNLRRLECYDVYDEEFDLTLLPLPTLTHFAASSRQRRIDIIRLASVISRCPQLTSLDLRLANLDSIEESRALRYPNQDDARTPIPRIPIPTLRQLTLRTNTFFSLSKLLSKMTFPGLQSLILAIEPSETLHIENSDNEIAAVITGCTSTLEHFACNFNCFSIPKIRTALQSVHCLRSLTVRNLECNDARTADGLNDLVLDFAPDGTLRSGFHPYLQHISLHGDPRWLDEVAPGKCYMEGALAMVDIAESRRMLPHDARDERGQAILPLMTFRTGEDDLERLEEALDQQYARLEGLWNGGLGGRPVQIKDMEGYGRPGQDWVGVRELQLKEALRQHTEIVLQHARDEGEGTVGTDEDETESEYEVEMEMEMTEQREEEVYEAAGEEEEEEGGDTAYSEDTEDSEGTGEDTVYEDSEYGVRLGREGVEYQFRPGKAEDEDAAEDD